MPPPPVAGNGLRPRGAETTPAGGAAEGAVRVPEEQAPAVEAAYRSREAKAAWAEEA
jgi:hypothetical protein